MQCTRNTHNTEYTHTKTCTMYVARTQAVKIKLFYVTLLPNNNLNACLTSWSYQRQQSRERARKKYEHRKKRTYRKHISLKVVNATDIIRHDRNMWFFFFCYSLRYARIISAKTALKTM